MTFTLKSTASRTALVLGAALTMAAPALAADVTGRVTDASGAVALEGAVVRIAEAGATATTGRDGVYRFTNLAAGEYTVSVSFIGGADASAVITLGEDGSVTQNFALAGAQRETIVVTGQRGSLFNALNQERAADNIIDVLGADAIGDFPDQNVAESARRIPGLTVANDQGEGRFVIIRGLDPNLNAVTINGVRTPSPEAGDRQVPLDVIDSELLDAIVVSKTNNADMDGDGIGGSLEVKSISAFDRDGPSARIRLEGRYSDISEAVRPKVAVTASNVFADGRLGVAGSVSYRERRFGSENTEVDGSWSDQSAADGDFLYPEEFELRNYDIVRERLSAALNFDFRASENHDLYLRTLFSEFSDQEYRARVEVKLDDANLVSGLSSVASGIGIFNNDGAEVEIDRDIKDRLEEQMIYSLVAGGQSRLNAWTFDYFASFAYAEESEPNRLDAGFRNGLDEDDFDDGDEARIGIDVSDASRPTLVFPDAASLANYSDPSLYEFDDLEFVNAISKDEEAAFGFDLQRDVLFGGRPGFVKSGFKARLREKSFDEEVDVYDGFDGEDLLLSQFSTLVDFPLDVIGATPDARIVRPFFLDNIGAFELNTLDTTFASLAGDYEANEDIYAGYLMGQVDISDRLRLTGGLRIEQTEFDASAVQAVEAALEEDGEGGFIAPTDGEFAGFEILAQDDEDAILGQSVTTEDSYVDFLPSVNLRWAERDSVVFRAAYSRTVARPNIEQFVPIAEFSIDEGGFEEAAVGNPDLERQISDNFDLALDVYLDNGGVLSGGLFIKDIDDYIAVQSFEDVAVRGVVFDEVVQAVNLEEASIVGFEFGYQQPFDFLPAPFDGLIIGANYTIVDGSAKLPSGRNISLPRLSENIANLVIGYEKNAIDLKASLSYRGEYLDVIDEGGAGIDRIISDHLQIDLSAKYDVTEQLRVYLDLQNINDEPFEAYFPIGGVNRLSQYEEYGFEANFGIQYKY